MKRTKEQNETIDATILSVVTERWETASELNHRVKVGAEAAGVPARIIDATVIGARLRSLKARGKGVESRLLDGYINEWRRSA